jgi:hypothetical protein
MSPLAPLPPQEAYDRLALAIAAKLLDEPDAPADVQHSWFVGPAAALGEDERVTVIEMARAIVEYSRWLGRRTSGPGRALAEFILAVSTAFTADDLDLLLLGLDVKAQEHFDLATGVRTLALRVVEWFERQGDLERFLREVARERPRNAAVQQAVARLLQERGRCPETGRCQ